MLRLRATSEDGPAATRVKAARGYQESLGELGVKVEQPSRRHFCPVYSCSGCGSLASSPLGQARCPHCLSKADPEGSARVSAAEEMASSPLPGPNDILLASPSSAFQPDALNQPRPGHANLKPNQVGQVILYGIPIVSLVIDGQERLCLAQISNTLLKNFSYNEIHNRRVALGITCVQCTPVQLEILRRAGAMPISSRRCGMITKREAERLCKSFLGENRPPKLPDNFAFDVSHECAWGCRGSFIPARYNSSRAKCIKCSYCNMYFSPNKFIFHSHRTPDAKYTQPDAANFNSWRRHLKLTDKSPQDELPHHRGLLSPSGTSCSYPSEDTSEDEDDEEEEQEVDVEGHKPPEGEEEEEESRDPEDDEEEDEETGVLLGDPLVGGGRFLQGRGLSEKGSSRDRPPAAAGAFPLALNSSRLLQEDRKLGDPGGSDLPPPPPPPLASQKSSGGLSSSPGSPVHHPSLEEQPSYKDVNIPFRLLQANYYYLNAPLG
ncbi:SKI family transcriptional corepressor 2, partial [Eschrichtius robustus]|nr:SKI family transcriptional corepressor 2 [Eschrichtius robustus]